ncbi:oleoyl-acyl carrier protein thioesterase, chloroplastic-like protein [Tanacetum coccineum]
MTSAPATTNAVTKHHIHPLTHSLSIFATIPRRNCVLLRSQSCRRAGLVMSCKQPNGVTVGLAEERSLAERLRLGGLTEDGLSYKEKFIIRCYEVGINKTATVETIANLLQEVIFTTLAYIMTNRSDVVEIETWCQSEGRIGTRRDWILKDYANGEVIGRATSKWVMMNEVTRRLQKVSDDVRDEYLVFCPKALRLAFPEENNNSLKKIGKLEDPAEYSRLGLVPRRADLDMNKHVNNVTYIGWVLESIPQEVIDTHELQSITLDYRRECQHDDIVDSLTTPEPLIVSSNGSIASKQDGENLSKFLHLLRSSDGLEINRCRTEWRKKPVKR